jgi:hypothetical protein
MYQKIKEGMIEKYGENYDYVEEIKKIIEKYKSKLEMLLENKGRL